MTAPNPNARAQAKRRDFMTYAANIAGYKTIDRMCRAIVDGRVACYYRQDNTLYHITTEPANVLIREDD